MILIDTDVIMYAAGAPHPNKAPSVTLLERAASGDLEATIDAEVLQEIPVTADILDRARQLLDVAPQIMARDALHAAVVMLEGLEAVCSYDRDFDRIPGLVRREPGA